MMLLMEEIAADMIDMREKIQRERQREGERRRAVQRNNERKDARMKA